MKGFCRVHSVMARDECDAEALAVTLMTEYPEHAYEAAARLRADALANGDIARSNFWDDVLAVLFANRY